MRHANSLQYPPTIVERAFELAGESGTLDEVRHKLKAEGYFSVDAHLAGPQIRSELSRLLDPELAARKKKAAQPGVG